MQEADYGTTHLAHSGANNRFDGDENLFVQFFLHAKMDQKKSDAAGRPIYNDCEYIKIMQPGNKDSIVTRPVRQMDKDRFPKQYAAFQNNEHQEMEGTPLSEWPQVTRAQVEELKYMNVHTVEQLARGISDSNGQNFMGFSLLRDKAKAFLAASGDSEAAQEIEKALKSRDEEIAELKNTVANMQEQMNQQGGAPDG